MTLIVDSYAWIEFLSAGKHGPAVRTHLESSELMLTPDIVLAEVARKYGREGMESRQVEGHLRSITALSDVVGVSVAVALQTPVADRDLRSRARSRKLGPPSFADVLILSVARESQGRVLTADRHFEGLPEVEWIGG